MQKYLLFILLPLALSSQAQTLADFYTVAGDFRVELREDLMPITANNFIDLARTGFYDATIFHRVVADFVIQGGDPLGTGFGGPGYTIMDEYHVNMNHDSAGVIAMAKTAAPNSAGSQFYFTLSPQPHLDGQYAAFGSCVQGLQVVLNIGKVAVNLDDQPLVPVVIDSIRIVNTTSIGLEKPTQLPLEVFPNPFREQCFIRYEVKRPGPIRLRVFDMQGRMIRSLVHERKPVGIYDVAWDGRAQDGAFVPAGGYLLLIEDVEGFGTKRLMKL
jgi:cyclophilin family peptidyl-prolyl cis-trans isomerase